MRALVLATLASHAGLRAARRYQVEVDGSGFQASLAADFSITQFSCDYYKEMEKLGKGNKDFGYAFQYIMNNKKIEK